MKRLFGLIGTIYLSVLLVVFYFYNYIVLNTIISASVVCIISGLVFILIKKYKNIRLSLIIAGATAICACLSMSVYTNIVYKPITDNYSKKEIKISGYVCDEIIKSDDSCIYTIETYTVNNNTEKIKIRLISYKDLHIKEFDKINATMYTNILDNNSLKSKGIYLTAFADDKIFSISNLGEKHFSLYSIAVNIRMKMENALDCLLPEEYSSLCKAVLLGDKYVLSNDVQKDFSTTGTSFLIVVSGMHLAVVTYFFLFLIKKITNNKLICCLSVIAVVLPFIALTGFSPSTTRAGIMLIITHCASVCLSRADSFNSMGFSALLLTITNPFAAGNVGLLLSFTSTAGIILWSQKLSRFVIGFLKIKNKALKYVIDLFSVSVSASLWVLPVTMSVFHRVPTLNVIISVIAGPLVSILIICALLAVLFYMCPFIYFMAYPFALLSGLVSKAVIYIISFFASMPYSSVNSDKLYFYVWLLVTILLVIVGYVIKGRLFYKKMSIIISLLTFIIGWAIFSLFFTDNELMTVYTVDNGVCACICNGDNLTFISCGGTKYKAENISEKTGENFSGIDNIIIPEMKNRYNLYLSRLVKEFDTENIFVYDKDSRNQKILTSYDGLSRFTFGDNVSFSLNLSNSITDEVINVKGTTYQYVKGSEKTVLFVPKGGDINNLPEKYRKTDYLLIDSVPDNIELLSCNTIIISCNKKYYDDIYNKIKELNCDIVSTLDGDLNFELNGGIVWQN